MNLDDGKKMVFVNVKYDIVEQVGDVIFLQRSQLNSNSKKREKKNHILKSTFRRPVTIFFINNTVKRERKLLKQIKRKIARAYKSAQSTKSLTSY